MINLFEPVGCALDLVTGDMRNATGHYQKRFDDLDGLYADTAAYDALRQSLSGQVVYEVREFRPAETPGDLIFGTTRMSPGKVGNEFFLTRGHIHKQPDRPEIYYGLGGRGVMLMESPEGEVRTVAVDEGSVCYVPPFWIHRSVNVGDTDLVMLFCYPADSGQDYDIIARSGGMRARIVDNSEGGWKTVQNPAWKPRAASEIADLYRSRTAEVGA